MKTLVLDAMGVITPSSKDGWGLRLAREEDIPALERLIPLSVRTLQAGHYSTAQIEAALGPVFGVDRKLICDGTYFVVEQESAAQQSRNQIREKIQPRMDTDSHGLNPKELSLGKDWPMKTSGEKRQRSLRRSEAMAGRAGAVQKLAQSYGLLEDNQIAGCGGWSLRKAMFGGDRERARAHSPLTLTLSPTRGRGNQIERAAPGCASEDELLDPKRDPARIRAFFVHPDFVRRGIGRSILLACEAAIRKAGFQSAELVATLTGEPLYAAFGYAVIERYEVPMAGGLALPVVRMGKRFTTGLESVI